MTATTGRSNRLSHETSPYLLAHSRNPVDWYPWGTEALGRAKSENKPIFLSIGYAACHWCHVMERESFEDGETARLLNAEFVCIKVDREERPDLDDIYMAATVAMSGHGGWPMSVFLTGDQEPFFAGTYFPPDDRHGRPGFKTLLLRIAELWKTDRERLAEQAKQLVEHVRGRSELLPGADVSADAFDNAERELMDAFDPDYGGFGDAPKFPPCASLSLLLRIHRKKNSADALTMVRGTLDGMKNGGIHDHIGGGFSRYSTDEHWLVPHFEKMLYDNAQLARVYLEAYQVTGSEEYRRVAAETLDYVAREMQSPEGGYYSATDADSEGVEGKFFVWTPDQIEELLGRPAAEAFCEYYDIEPSGNWEGVSIPNTPRSMETVAAELGVPVDELRRSLAESRQKVYAARLRRVPPLTDDKVLASWNGLMIGAMAEGARVLGEKRYLDSAERAARFVTNELARSDGGLYRTARAGKAHLDGYLEDYACFADALVDLYEAGATAAHLREATRLSERMIADFGDESGAFFNTAKSHEALIARTREGHDGATPSANAVAARVLARLGFHLGRSDFRDRAVAAVRAYGKMVERSPRAFATTLAVADLLMDGPVELAFVGGKSAELESLLREVGRHYLPNRIVAHGEPSASGVTQGEHPLLAGKELVQGRAALYVCRDFSCKAPVTRPEDVRAAIRDSEEVSRNRSRPVEGQLSGSATAADTARFAERFSASLGSSAYSVLAGSGLTVSRFGFGTYRVDDRVEEHRDALREALRRGVNLVDSSTNYSDGHSEKLVGEVLRELDGSGEVPRSAVVVVSKIGYVQGKNLRVAREREANGKPFPEMVNYAEGLLHCISPEWIEDQLGRSLERLRLERLDVCLLHNPEYFLGDAEKRGVPIDEARTEFYRRVTEAFRHFEREVGNGRISSYGVSSNTLVDAATDGEATDLARFLEAAREAGGEAHHFRVVQVPMNLLEAGAALERNTGEGRSETVLELAAKNGLSVLVNRPLNGIVEGRLVRLAEPAPVVGAPPLSGALERLRALEAEFETEFASSIRLPPESRMKPAEVLRWNDRLSTLAADIESLEQWRELESHAVGPRIMQTIGALDRALGGTLGERWHGFRDRYLMETENVFAALRSRATDRSRARSLGVCRVLDPFLPEERRFVPLSQKALQAMLSLPGVTSVLVGMRQRTYVEDALATMGAPALADALGILQATSRLELS